VPDLIGVLGQLNPLQLLFAVFVKQANLYLGCVGGEDRKVGALSIPAGAAWVGKAFCQGARERFRHDGCSHDDLSPLMIIGVGSIDADSDVLAGWAYPLPPAGEVLSAHQSCRNAT